MNKKQKNKKTKVCMLAHNPPFQGGIVQYCVLLENYIKDKINLNIIGFHKLYPPFFYKGELPKHNKSGINFNTHCSNFITWYNPISWIKAYCIMSKSEVMLIQWVSPLLTPLQYIILKLNKLFKKRKVILTCHNIEPHESTILDKIFTKTIFNLSDHFIVHAAQNKIRMINDYKKNPENVHVVPHGTFGFFTKWKKESKSQLRKKFNLKDDDIVLLFFGYIREYKGLRYLLRAMHKIIEQQKQEQKRKRKNITRDITKNNIKLIIAGELWQNKNEYKKELKGLENYVKIYPRYIIDPEVHKFFDVSDICVLPYHNTEQTISGPLLVALAFGKPTIVSPVGGVKELIKDKKEAIFSQGGNVNLLTNNILNLINNKKLQTKLSKNALKKNSEFLWDNVASEYFNVIKKVIKEKEEEEENN